MSATQAELSNIPPGVFDYDGLFSVIVMPQLHIDASSPYSVEHIVQDPSIAKALTESDEFSTYQRTLVHEKAHFYTAMGSTYFVARFLAHLETAHHFASERWCDLRPFSKCADLPHQLAVWIDRHIIDELYYDVFCKGVNPFQSRLGEWIGDKGIAKVLSIWQWDEHEARDLINSKQYQDIAVIELTEGIGRAAELYYFCSLFDSGNAALRDMPKLDVDQLKQRFDLEVNNFFESDVYVRGVLSFREAMPSAPLEKLLPIYCIAADIALSPPIPSSGWPELASAEFSMEESLPQTRFEIVRQFLCGVKGILDASKNEIYAKIEDLFAEKGWQCPRATYQRLHQRLSNRQSSVFAHERYLDYCDRSWEYSRHGVPGTLDQAIREYFNIRGMQIRLMTQYAAVKSQSPVFTAPPVDTRVIKRDRLHPRCVTDWDGEGFGLPYFLAHFLLLKAPRMRLENAVYGAIDTCPVQESASELFKLMLRESLIVSGGNCQCAGQSSECALKDLLSIATI